MKKLLRNKVQSKIQVSRSGTIIMLGKIWRSREQMEKCKWLSGVGLLLIYKIFLTQMYVGIQQSLQSMLISNSLSLPSICWLAALNWNVNFITS